MFKLVTFVFILTLNFAANASCISSGSAFFYGCVESDEQYQIKECQDKYGDSYSAYKEVDSCTKEWAAFFRGEGAEPGTEKVIVSEETISCFTYTQGNKLNCSLVDDREADSFCAYKFGAKYLPYLQSNLCSIEKADELYGYASGDEIVGDLKPMIAQAEAIMFMIDRENIKESLGGLISLKPIMGNDFYSPVMKGLLSKLKIIQTELKNRSQLKINFRKPEVKELIEYVIKYVNLTNRVHRVYAHIAHKNHKELKTYSFDNLEFLNLVVSKSIALEVMDKFNLMARNLENDMVEFSQFEQSKQIYEYLALSEPRSKVDYAKLISFMGLRENLTNLWALDKLSERSLLDKSIQNYGSFLSFRKERYGAIKDLPTIVENQESDLFYNGYWERDEKIIEITNSINLLDQDESKLVFFELFSENRDLFGEYISSSIDQTVQSTFDYYLEAESFAWKNFSEFHIRKIILPGDGIQDSKNLVGLIADEVYKRRVDAIVNSFEGIYALLEEKEISILSEKLKDKIRDHIKYSFLGDLRVKLYGAFRDYNERREFARENYAHKIKESVETLKQNAKIASQYLLFDTKLNVNPNIRPRNYEELTYLFENKISYKYMDIKKALEEDEKLAGALTEFFNKVAEAFNSEFLVQNLDGSHTLKGTDEERSDALVTALFDTAREYYEKNNFEITELAMVPEAVLLAKEQDREKLSNNPYMIPIYRDGTPVTVHIDEFYESFQASLNLVIKKRSGIERLMGLRHLDDLGNRDLADQMTDGTFDQPISYIFSNGEIYYENVNANIDEEALKRMYLSSLSQTKSEIGSNYADKKRALSEKARAKKEQYEEVPEIKTTQKLFARVFELFNIPMGSIVNNIPVRQFTLSKADQKVIAENAIAKSYTNNPILRLEFKSEERKEEWIQPMNVNSHAMPYIMNTKVNKERSILLKAAYHAYDLESDIFDEVKATQYVQKVIKEANRNIKNNLVAFANINYLKIKENPQLRRAFRAASYLRQTLKSPTGTTIDNAKRIEHLDGLVLKDIRTKSEAVNEDYLEPIMLWMGAAAITAVGIMLMIGSMGVAAPAILSAFITFEYITGAALMVASTSVRINSGFYETPAQIRFQKSIASSQITDSKLADFDMIKEEEKSLRLSQMIEIGLMPLNLLYGKMLVSSARKTLGSHAKKSFEKLSNTKLRGYSAPPTSFTKNASYTNLRKEYGVIKGAYKTAKYSLTRAKAYLPKYHNLPEEMVGTNLLRVGILNALKKINIYDKPWKLADDLRGHSGKLKDKITKYHKFVEDETAVVAQIERRKVVDREKVVALTAHHNRFNYTMRSFGRAVKEFKLIEYLKNFKGVRKEMQYLNEQLLKNKVLKIEKMIDKIEALKLKRAGEELAKNDSKHIQELLSEFSDEEIMLLREVSNKSGNLSSLKKVYKQYDEISGGRNFKPASYLYGHIDEKFRAPIYDTTAFLGQKGAVPALKSDAEDLVNFYESLIQQNGFKDEATQNLRKSIEEKISSLFIIDKNGARMYPAKP